MAELKLTPAHIAVGAGLVLAAVLVFSAMGQSGGAPVPVYTEDVIPPVEPHLATAAELGHEVTYLAIRYPVSVGADLTRLIHRGWASVRVDDDDPLSSWIMCPPSEQAVLSGFPFGGAHG